MIKKEVFNTLLEKVMEHNDYNKNLMTVAECNEKNFWTPVDLIIREFLCNGGKQSMIYLGISPRECKECYNFIKHNLDEFRSKDLINDSGFIIEEKILWENYKI